MRNKPKNGLTIKMVTGESVFITPSTSTAVAIELVLHSTDKTRLSAKVSVFVSGERIDIDRLGIHRLADEKTISRQPTELFPGISLMLGTGNSLGQSQASMCFVADRKLWTIARACLVEKSLRQHGRQLTFATAADFEGGVK